MGRRRLSLYVEGDPTHIRILIEKFNYCDTNHDGTVSLEELQEVIKALDPEYDAAQTEADFNRMDANGNGKISLDEFLKFEGIDISKFKDDDLEAIRQTELANEQAALARGVAAVEIAPNGEEASACAAAVEAVA